ncbi:alpha/beta hydrolase [Desulfofustis limnaeus]|uniref:Serine aminopeptidase S33 domain-containing protein n=1 Tax=Desulfofustis limnaeus TaxID=2740163 RepID=A0ABM7W8K3_9BACT|nr:alpha/beta fold hydrolase [Desulfofustis limnaeus]BDD87228.1 hypothetical protein DPPLL_15930 [Desulfofustis limnaeus]
MIETFPLPVKLDTPQIGSVLFHPRPETSLDPPAGAVDFAVNTEDGRAVLGCRAFIGEQEHAPVILFFHGNGETVGDYDDIGPLFLEVGINVVFATYRGYGWSTGVPSASKLVLDAESVLVASQQWLQDHSLSGPLFVMGRSLGSVSAIELVYRFPDRCRGLLIESGFADTVPLLATIGVSPIPEELAEADCFNNRRKIAHIELPTLILHGARDQLIPIGEAEKLQAESGARNKQFQVVPGADHNSLMLVAGPLYFAAIKQFIDGVTGVNTWRERRRHFKREQSA